MLEAPKHWEVFQKDFIHFDTEWFCQNVRHVVMWITGHSAQLMVPQKVGASHKEHIQKDYQRLFYVVKNLILSWDKSHWLAKGGYSRYEN